MNEKIKLTKSNGTTIEADIICFLEDLTSSKKYVYYTLNEIVGVEPSSTVKIYVAKIKQNDATDVPISEEEWGKLKGIMGEVLKDTDNTTVKYLPQTELGDAVIVDEKVIAMPTMYDYISKHRGVYANKVTIELSNPAPVEAPVLETPTEVSAPSIEPIEAQPIVEEKVEEPIVSEPVQPPVEETTTPEVQTSSLESIDIDEIEVKYNKMIEDINDLKNREIEAAKRYNATLELSAMHNAQHASYVQSEQTVPETNPAPVIKPAPTIEPTPVVATPIEPQANNVDIETNWFDMQPQG